MDPNSAECYTGNSAHGVITCPTTRFKGTKEIDLMVQFQSLTTVFIFLASWVSANVKPGSVGKEEFSGWPRELFAIGTLGNEKSAENLAKIIIPEQENPSSSSPPSTQHLAPGEIWSLQELISVLGKQEENNLPEELTRFSEEIQEESNGAEGGSFQCTTKWREQSFDGSKNVLIRKKSLSFLLKNIFLCRSGFPPWPSLRDPPPEPRIEKVTYVAVVTCRSETISRRGFEKNLNFI